MLMTENVKDGNSVVQLHRDRSLGAILVDAGRLKPEDAERILREQKTKGMRFGDAGVALGLIQQSDIDFALSRQFDYPYLQPGDTSVSEELVAAFRPFSPVVEQLRALRSQIMLRWFNGEPTQSAIAVLGAERGDGRSFIAANLAVVFSQLGERTLLIDANMRSPAQHKLFKLENRAGLSGVLAERCGLEAIVRIPSLLGLSVLPSGVLPPNPQELLARTQFSRLLEQAASSYDAIIIDTCSLSSGADAQIVAARAKASIVVARRNVTLLKDLSSFRAIMSQTNSTLLGAVLSDYS